MGYFEDLVIVQTAHKYRQGTYRGNPINPPYFSICLLRQGELDVLKDGVRYHLLAPFIFWAIPGHFYHFFLEKANGMQEAIWLDLGGERAKRIWCGLEELPKSSQLGIPVSCAVEMAEIMIRIIALGKKRKPILQHRIVIMLEELLGMIYEEIYGIQESDRSYPLIIETIRMFSRVPEKKYDLYEIAKRGGLSYDSFRKKFRFFSGTSPYGFLLDCRFDKAIRLMHDHTLTIKDISNSCGFSSLSVFSRFFYQHCGEYPKVFREKMKRILDV